MRLPTPYRPEAETVVHRLAQLDGRQRAQHLEVVGNPRQGWNLAVVPQLTDWKAGTAHVITREERAALQ